MSYQKQQPQGYPQNYHNQNGHANNAPIYSQQNSNTNNGSFYPNANYSQQPQFINHPVDNSYPMNPSYSNNLPAAQSFIPTATFNQAINSAPLNYNQGVNYPPSQYPSSTPYQNDFMSTIGTNPAAQIGMHLGTKAFHEGEEMVKQNVILFFD